MGLRERPRHVFAAVDLERDALGTALERAAYTWAEPACLSWLGVTQYLSTDAISATLTGVASSCAPGSEIVLTYVLTEPYLDDVGLLCLERNRALAAAGGEDWRTFLAPEDAADLVETSGLRVRENLLRDDLHRRYFTGRTDGLTPYTLLGCLSAVVPDRHG